MRTKIPQGYKRKTTTDIVSCSKGLLGFLSFQFFTESESLSELTLWKLGFFPPYLTILGIISGDYQIEDGKPLLC